MRATTIESETGITLSWDQAAHDLIHAFEDTHQMRFTPGQLTPQEIKTAGQIQSEKYADASWTERI
jgi:lipoate-protein ligase A